MRNEWLEQIIKLTEQGEEFAIAQVISREIPSSGKPGDKAIILKDGSLIGWIEGDPRKRPAAARSCEPPCV